jgi:hypothetical protein
MVDLERRRVIRGGQDHQRHEQEQNPHGNLLGSPRRSLACVRSPARTGYGRVHEDRCMSEPSIDYATRARPDALTSSGNTVAEADVCFVSHTAIRSAGPIAPLEATGGIPVTTSNQGLAWHTLNRPGIADAPPGFPRLFAIPFTLKDAA